jgi:hypothetical protein
VHVGQGTSTNVVFAVAEKPSYDLIPASAACELLKNTEVKCLADDTNTSGSEGDGAGESGFPLWIIYIVAGVILVVFIITLVVIRRRRAKKVCVLCCVVLKQTLQKICFLKVTGRAGRNNQGDNPANISATMFPLLPSNVDIKNGILEH